MTAMTIRIRSSTMIILLLSSTLFLAPDAWSANKLTVNYHVTYSWATGFETTVTIRNRGPEIENWRLEFDLAHTIEATSNAILEERVGDHYVIKGPEQDPGIPPNGSVTFWFVANLEPHQSQFPGNCQLNSESCRFESSSEVASLEANTSTETEGINDSAPSESEAKQERQISPWESRFLNFIPTFQGAFR
ncbi:MAG: cellulose binding domain-containing protein [Bdellovibrionia bacterium]